MPNKKLIIIGDGSQMQKFKKLANENITLKGHLPRVEVIKYMSRAKVFVFMPKEDFGIVPIEAQACGTPVIAYGRGGAAETVVDINDSKTPTGVFVKEQKSSSLIQAVIEFEKNKSLIKPEYCLKNAKKFSVQRFKQEFKALIEKKGNYEIL